MSDDLQARFGSARHPERAVQHKRPEQITDAEVDADGKVSAALEVIEHARGLLYGFHRMSGQADLALQDAVSALRGCGHPDLADEIDEVLVGRDVVPGYWTFQLIEAYDAEYWSVFRAVAEKVRSQLAGGAPHVFEAEMKVNEQTGGASPT
jgi:hypothetical protein